MNRGKLDCRRGVRQLIWAAVLLLWPLVTSPALGKTWTTSGSEAFSRGKLDGVSVLSTGEMVLGPPVEMIKGIEAKYVWDIAVGKKDVAYVATGSPACVYALSGNEVKLLHKTGERHVLSVLALDDGSVLAATAPRGIIYKIDSGGTVTVLTTLDEPYIWDMALGPNGEVYCATGPNGKLIKLDAQGKATEVFKADEHHFMCLAVDPNGVIYAGTEPEGLVYRIQPDGKATVLYDADEGEVHCLVLTPDGVLYAGTAQAQGAPQAGPPGPRAEDDGPSGASGMPEAPGPIEHIQLPGQPTVPNSVYRIVPGEGAVRLAQFPGTVVLSLALADDGEVLAGSGVQGRVFGVDAVGRTRIMADFEATHISAMARDSTGSVILATSGGGGLWRLGKGRRTKGTFTTDIFDADYVARWGRIWWRGTTPLGTGMSVSMHTGNSRKPDATWSEWSPPLEDASSGQLQVPMGRFAEMKADLRADEGTAGPLVIELSASYRQVNLRPLVSKLVVDDGQPSGPPQPSEPQAGRPSRGKRTISWQASDPNRDDLVFDLYYRAVGENEWKELKKDIKGQPAYEWDVGRVPDGYYLVRLVAADRLARSPQETLEGEMVTPPVLIDNRPPEVLGLEAKAQEDNSFVITGLAKDSYSNIAAMQVSLDSQNWLPVFPLDGILDATTEEFFYRTEPLAKGEHVLVFAATDDGGNAGSEKIVVMVK